MTSQNLMSERRDNFFENLLMCASRGVRDYFMTHYKIVVFENVKVIVNSTIRCDAMSNDAVSPSAYAMKAQNAIYDRG